MGDGRPQAHGGWAFDAEVFRWEGNAAWHFVALPPDVTDEIDDQHGHRTVGFGSIRVEVTVGGSVWQTSLFPDTKRRTFVLPLKKAVRLAEGLDQGTLARFAVRVLDLR